MDIDLIEVEPRRSDSFLTRELIYGFQPSFAGQCLIALFQGAVSALSFVDVGQEESALTRLSKAWPGFSLRKDSTLIGEASQKIFARGQLKRGTRVKILLKGTHFQRLVWKALLSIPQGETVSYQEIAKRVGRPRSVRAVGQAVGRNPVAIFIPCHRVLRKDGQLGGYRWGPERKQLLLAGEGALEGHSLLN